MQLFGVMSFMVLVATTIPYMVDIVRGRVQPARSTRIMFVLLMALAILQQGSLGAGWGLSVIIGEFVTAVMLLGLGVRYGVGGWTHEDRVCYLLLTVSLLVWAAMNNAWLALWVTMVADLVAFWPTLTKTWRLPSSETPLYYIGGVIAAGCSVVAEGSLAFGLVGFAVYLAVVNLLEVGLIYRLRLMARRYR
jgi:hypothetical protein